ncbi:MAG TPA: terpene cyclase/mutase family protein, partial [Planctomycetota bacterium]|nr:terpene cyclase/mutase family protein [Planctomycetota bacterium]
SAVEAALRWLARHQEADGHWDIKKWEGGGDVSGGLANDEAVTAMAVLAFLGAGYTHKSGGLFQDNVKRATEWLLARQRPDGSWTDNHPFETYALGLSTLALAEAYGMTKDVRLLGPAQKGTDHILKVQNRYAGWQHGSNLSTSVTGWMVMALKSAKIAGLKVDGTGFQGANNWLDQVTDKGTGKVGYNSRSQSPWGAGLPMTAVGMVCRQFMGTPSSDPLLIKQADLLARTTPKWEARNNPTDSPQDPYYWYYGTLAMFQMGGRHWDAWNAALKPVLVDNQCKGGPMDGSAADKDGSWDCGMGWGPTGGRAYHTAINALSLEVYYRYLPMYAK